MKKLKSYKLFESKSDIINHLEDILMEISDDGIDVNIVERTEMFNDHWGSIRYGDNLLEITLGDYKKVLAWIGLSRF